MIVVTGGEGFIGKNLVQRLRLDPDISVVSLDTRNTSIDYIYNWITTNAKLIDGIYHIGAISDTTEQDERLFEIYNINMSIFIWNVCSSNQIPLVYASSAATYGDGSLGFDDELDIDAYQPLNQYGWSKQLVDERVTILANKDNYSPPFWAGLKFFNVYGSDESHKKRMASMVYHTFNQVMSSGKVKLFKSHRKDYAHGEQLRDFIFIDDIIDVCTYMMKEKPTSGIYNVGTGKARSFNDLAKAVFKSMNKRERIKYINTPKDLREQYQYYTQATTKKLRAVGYTKPFTELEDGVDKYVKDLLH